MTMAPRDANAPNAPILPRMIITATQDGGLGHFDLVADPYARIAMVLGPLSLDEVGAGDTLRAYMTVQGQPQQIASYVLKASDFPAGDESSPIFTLEAEASEVNKYPDGSYPFSYDVLYSNGFTDESIVPLVVRIKRTIPGTPAQPSDPVNDLLSPPEVMPNPVSAKDTSAAVTVAPWNNMAEGDLVTVHWERLRVTGAPVTSGGVGQPVTVTITADQLKEVGGMIGLPVAYEIFDVVGNHSGRSPYTLVDVQIEPPGALPEPRILEAVGGVIDPDRQGGADFTISIPAAGDAPARGIAPVAISPQDAIVAYFEGRIPGTGIIHRYVSPPLTAPDPIFELRIPLPVAETLPLRGGTAQVSYRVTPKAGGPELPSRHMGVVVVGVPDLLPAPTIPEDLNQDDVLNPDTEIAGGAHALISYPDMAVNDLIYLELAGRRADGTADNLPVEPRQVLKVAPQSIPVDKAYLLRLRDGALTLTYAVDSDSVVVHARRDSAARTVSISDGTVQPSLPAPTLSPGIVDGLLDPAARDVLLIVGRAVLQVGDLVEFSWRARHSDAGKLTVRIDDDLRFPIDDALITNNLDSEVVATYTRTRGGATAASEPLTFRIADAAGLVLPKPSVQEAPTGQLDPGAAPDGITVAIAPTPAIAPTDDVTVTITGPGGNHTVSPVTGSANGMSIAVGPAVIGKNLSLSITVQYSVTPKSGGAARTSPPTNIDVLDFQVNDPRVGRPDIVEAAGGTTVDLNLFPDDASVEVPAWPLMASGQVYWLTASSAGTSQAIATAVVVTVAGKLQHTLARTWLDTLNDSAPLTIRLDIAFAGGEHASAHAFSSKTYTVRARTGAQWDLEFDFDRESTRQISSRTPDAKLSFADVFDFLFHPTQTTLPEQFIGVRPYVGGAVDDYFAGQVLWIGHPTVDVPVTKRVLCRLVEAWSEVRFALSAMDAPVKVSFRDAADQLVGSTKTVNASGTHGQYAEVRNDPVAGRTVKTIEIECPDTIHLDFFRFRR